MSKTRQSWQTLGSIKLFHSRSNKMLFRIYKRSRFIFGRYPFFCNNTYVLAHTVDGAICRQILRRFFVLMWFSMWFWTNNSIHNKGFLVENRKMRERLERSEHFPDSYSITFSHKKIKNASIQMLNGLCAILYFSIRSIIQSNIDIFHISKRGYGFKI